MKTYVQVTGWDSQANLVTMSTLVIMVTWGIPSYPNNSYITGAIRKYQRSNCGGRAIIITHAYVY